MLVNNSQIQTILFYEFVEYEYDNSNPILVLGYTVKAYYTPVNGWKGYWTQEDAPIILPFPVDPDENEHNEWMKA